MAAAKLDRRGFMRSTLAATAMAAVPGSRVWADAAKPATVPDQLAAVSLAGKPVSLTSAEIRELRSALRGPLLLAQDDGYDRARRLWNPAFDRHPALIARVASATDVIHAVDFARTHQLRTAVRAGGHSLSGQSACDGGLMIDVTPMKGMQVDVKRLRAQVQCGVLLGELDRAMQAVGLATTLGTVTDTGIAGLTLGGGIGRLMRKYGLTIDNLVSVDVVSADGKLRHASDRENPDLFWAVRGGGGNFGVVTSFEYQLHPFNHKVLSGEKIYPYSQARTVFAAMAELAESAPDELYVSGGVANFTTGPNLGRYAAFGVDYCGDDPAVGARLLEPLRKLGTPLLDTVAAVPYLAAQGAQSAANVAVPNEVDQYVETGFLRSTPTALFDVIVRRFETLPSSFDASAGMSHMAGAVARVRPDATAYWNRSATYDFLSQVSWTERSRDAEGAKVSRDMWEVVKPFTEGYYVNTSPGADNSRVRATYGDNYQRLVAIKDKYDPGNLFRMNANIRPSKPVA